MDIDQQVRDLPQLCGGGGAAIDPGPALGLQIDGALEQQLFAGRQTVFIEPACQRGRAVKCGADFAALRAFAHHGGVGARTQCKLQGVDQDGLAGAGFAGQHGEAFAQVQLQGVDDHKIPQKNTFQTHETVLVASWLWPQATPSFQCSFLRKVSK